MQRARNGATHRRHHNSRYVSAWSRKEGAASRSHLCDLGPLHGAVLFHELPQQAVLLQTRCRSTRSRTDRRARAPHERAHSRARGAGGRALELCTILRHAGEHGFYPGGRCYPNRHSAPRRTCERQAHDGDDLRRVHGARGATAQQTRLTFTDGLVEGGDRQAGSARPCTMRAGLSLRRAQRDRCSVKSRAAQQAQLRTDNRTHEKH